MQKQLNNMNSFLSKIQHNYYEILKILSFTFAIAIVVWITPRESHFKYEFHIGKPWNHKDLIAPFDFSILKTQEQINKEKEMLLSNFKPYFSYDEKGTEAGRSLMIKNFSSSWQQFDSLKNKQTDSIKELQTLLSIYDHVEKGIIRFHRSIEGKSPNFAIRLIKGNKAYEVKLKELFTINKANAYAGKIIRSLQTPDSAMLMKIIANSLVQNVIYDDEKNRIAKRELVSQILPTQGLIQKGELIISQGEVVTPEKYQILNSLKTQYEQEMGKSASWKYVLLGIILLNLLLFYIEFFFLKIFKPQIFNQLKYLNLILFTQVILIIISELVFANFPSWSYLIPYTILPVMIAAFLDRGAALVIHLITLMILGFYAPNSFEFFYTQFIAGFIAIFSTGNLSKRWYLVKASIWVFVTYVVVYMSMLLVQDGTLKNISYPFLAMLAGSSLLILLAFPFIFIYEKLFGMLTQLTLLELSNTNNKLLRDLAEKAPGTFQHSLQVANLASEVLYIIGGDANLARTGALYHDIGKMKNPMFFVENQSKGYNPHDELSYEESAKIIIGHVLDGIEMARKEHIPEQIIDFIRTHHGKRRVEYFYRLEKKLNPGVEVDPTQFAYHGPIPFSIETAVVMIADSVEAASRSISEPTEQKINDLVEMIVNGLLDDHQLDNAPLTLKQLTTAKKILKKKLLHIHHIRIAYPD